MSIIIGNLIRSVQKHTSYNILIYPFDGCFEYYLAQECPQYTFYRLTSIPKIPFTHTLWKTSNNLYDIIGNIPPYLTFDYIVCNDTDIQYKLAYQLASILHLPLIMINHTSGKLENQIHTPAPGQPPVSEHRYVSSSLINKIDDKQYDTLTYGIPQQLEQTPKKHQACLISNLQQSDELTIQNLIHIIQTELLLPIKIYHTNNLPYNKNSIFEPIETQQQYYQILQDSMFYIQLQSTPYIPNNILHAMAAKCCILANSSPITNNLLAHDKGIIFDGINQLIPTLKHILNSDDTKIINQHQQNAQIYIQEQMSIKNLGHSFQTILNNIQKEFINEN